MGTLNISEETLVHLLRSGNKQGLSILYDNYSGALLGVIMKIIPEQESAEDVLQEAFVKIWLNFASYDPAKGRLFTWMMNISRNLAIDKARSRNFVNHSKNQSLSNSVSVSKENDLDLNPDLIGVKKLTDELEPEYKSIIDLLYFQGYTQTEAAEELGIPLGTVKTRARAAISQLRQKFDLVTGK